MVQRRKRGVAAAIAMALVAAACSGGDDPPAATTAEDTVAPTDAPDTDPPSTDPPAALDEGDSTVIELDPEVLTGKLANGLTYYVRSNDRPGGQAELRLAINAGSSLEEEDQSGVAHFLEHMMFNGTEKYAKNELIEVLQRSGSEFGADINAYTSYDETVYKLNVDNTDDELELGLDILHQWLTAATIDPDQVVAERGIVLDEYRTRELTGDGRVFNAIEGLYLDGTAYEGRSPIGLQEAIEEMTAEPLRRFYDDWYRPDNAAIIVVGDIDPEQMVEQIEALFGDTEARGDSPERPELTWQGAGEPEATVVTDDELTTASVELALPRGNNGPQDTVGARNGGLLDYVAMAAIANRLSTDVTRGDAPFNNAEPSASSFVRPLEAPSVYLDANSDDAGAAAEALIDEFARVLQYGLSDADVERAVEEVRAGVDATFDSRDTVQDRTRADGLVEFFLTGRPYPSADDDYEITTELLDAIDADAVNERFAARLGVAPPVLVVTTAEGAAGLPDEADLVDALSALDERPVDEREDVGEVGDALMDRPPAAEITSQLRINGEPGFFIDPVEVTFENGVRVIINPTDIVDDYIELYAVSPGGFAATAPEDAPAVWLMNEVNSESGFGAFDAVQVETILGSTTAEVFPYPSESTELFGGSSSPGDLELAMQTINQYFTASNFDQSALDRARERNLGYVADLSADPDLATEIELRTARYGDDPRFRVVLTADELEAITTDQLERVWEERFGNPADFVFIFSGDLDVDETIELAASYLGTLPTTADRETEVSVAPPPPAGVVVREVEAGSGDTAQLVVQYSVPATGGPEDAIKADLLTAALNIRLTNKIREELGASYSPFAQVSISGGPAPEVVSTFYVTGAPADMARIAEVLQAELADVRANGPNDDEFAAAVAEVSEQYQLISNEEIIGALEAWLSDPDAISDYANQFIVVESISRADVQAFAAAALPAGQYIQVTTLPRQ